MAIVALSPLILARRGGVAPDPGWRPAGLARSIGQALAGRGPAGARKEGAPP
jgi:hypothetical protein